MLPRGRPPGPGTAEEKAAIRREKVRLNVKAYRERKKNALAAAAAAKSPSSSYSQPSPTSSLQSTASNSTNATSVDQHEDRDEHNAIVIRAKNQPVPLPSLLQRNVKGVQQSLPEVRSWVTPDGSSIYSTAFLSVFRNSFLPSAVNLPVKSQDTSLLITPCAPWISSAYNMALGHDSSALKSGLLAIGLILNGMEKSSSNLKIASYQMHRQALFQLRNDLDPVSLQRRRDYSRTSVISSYLSCLAIAMFEMIQTGFSPAILQHVKALNSLIEVMYADPTIDRYTVDLITEDFGMLEMIFCLKYGSSSTLCQTRRKMRAQNRTRGDVEHPRGNVSVYGDIMDIVEELPAIVIRLKHLSGQPASTASRDELQHIIRRLFRIQGDLDAWNIQFEVRHHSVFMSESYRDQKSGKSGSRPRLRSYEHGAVGLFIHNFQLCAIDANIEATTALASMQQSLTTRVENASEEAVSTSDSDVRFRASPSAGVEQRDDPEVSPTCSGGRGFLYEQLKAQRSKARSVVIQLLELMNQFTQVASNVTGQSLLIGPCDTVSIILEKEQTRLKEDLRQLPPKDHAGASDINRYLRDIEEASGTFQEFRRQQNDVEAVPDDALHAP